MLIDELLHSACLRLEKVGVSSPEIDAALLLGNCLGKSRTALYLMGKEVVPSDVETQFFSLLQRREQREPIAYILGTQEFWSLDFLVGPDVLIPRPETELLIEKSLKIWDGSSQSSGYILDLCCGSGVIAVVLAKELGEKVVAVDVSMRAILVARENARKHGVSHLIDFMQSDLLSGVAPVPCLSLVLSNPPYVSDLEIANGLQAEVGFFEPHLALNGGKKGLEVIRRINEELRCRMLPGSSLLMEIATGQGDDVLAMFGKGEVKDGHFKNLCIHKDYGGHDRIFCAGFEY